MEDRVALWRQGRSSPPSSPCSMGTGGLLVAEFLEKELWPAYKKSIETALSKGRSLEWATARAYEEVDGRTLAPPRASLA
ncbi:hypothetical protein CLOM_g401 [Closterium sp. NIES-68]|nr:hypothetical protein CLOM_g401 [Closterium sp. NIES-68]